MIKKITPETKIIPVKGAEIPFREGTKTRARVNAVLRAKKVENAIARGARMSTVRRLVELKVIKVA